MAIFLIIMAIMLVAPLLFERLRLPGIVSLILAGVIVSPHGFGLLDRDNTIVLLGTVGLLFLMFMAGLETSLDDLKYNARKAVIGVAEKRDDLERSSKHPALFSSQESATPSDFWVGDICCANGAGNGSNPSQASPQYRILVPVANPSTEDNLLQLALILTKSTNGTLLPLHVLTDTHAPISTEAKLQQERLLVAAETIAQAAVTDVETIGRVDDSVDKGILRTTQERNANLVICGWKGYYSTYQDNFFGSVIDTLPVVPPSLC